MNRQFGHLGLNQAYDVRREFAAILYPMLEEALGKTYKPDGALHLVIDSKHDADKEVPKSVPPPRDPNGPSHRQIKRERKSAKPRAKSRSEAVERVIDGIAYAAPPPFPHKLLIQLTLPWTVQPTPLPPLRHHHPSPNRLRLRPP